jgi:hypothetical protein
MSTVCKLDPEVRRRRAMRRNLLRTRAKSHAEIVIMAELALIAANPRLTGETKQALFERGARQLVGSTAHGDSK